jgi:acetolactate synthase-1/2/3 large subunit
MIMNNSAYGTASCKSFVIDVAMLNEPVPTAGHWNINDIHSPGRSVSHVAVP